MEKIKSVELSDSELGVIIAAIYNDSALWNNGRPASIFVERLLHKLVEAKEGTIRMMMISDSRVKE